MIGDFTVSQSGEAAEQFGRCLELLRISGLAKEAARSARWILEELARTPMQFGESREHLTQLELHGREGFAGRWIVSDSVSLSSHQVFIKRWALSRS